MRHNLPSGATEPGNRGTLPDAADPCEPVNRVRMLPAPFPLRPHPRIPVQALTTGGPYGSRWAVVRSRAR